MPATSKVGKVGSAPALSSCIRIECLLTCRGGKPAFRTVSDHLEK